MSSDQRSKQRKKQEEKLEEILPLAEVQLRAKGIVGFSPNDIIDNCSLSRATYYKEAPNITSIYLLLGVKGLNLLINMILRIEKTNLPPRDQLTAFITAKKILKDTHPVLYECIILSQLELVRKDNSADLINLFDIRAKTLDDFTNKKLNEAIYKSELKPLNQINNIHFREVLAKEFMLNSNLSFVEQAEKLNEILPWKDTSDKSNKAMIDKIMANIFKDESIILSQLN